MPPSSTRPPERAPRRGFALTGPSARLDPRHHAVRGDLADLRLADQVFAPHYAQPMPCRLARATPLLDKPKGEALAMLAAGDSFDLLELAGGHGWGVAVGADPDAGLVGYVDRTALECL